MFSIMFYLIGIFVALSPIIAVIAIIRWIVGGRTRNKNILNNYQSGYADGYRQATLNIRRRLSGSKEVAKVDAFATGIIYTPSAPVAYPDYSQPLSPPATLLVADSRSTPATASDALSLEQQKTPSY